jgi:hypothetical protein
MWPQPRPRPARRVQPASLRTGCCNGLGLGVAIVDGIFVASPLRFAPPRDVAVVSTYSVPVQDSGTQTSANTPD